MTLFPCVSTLVLGGALMACNLNPMRPPLVIPSATARVACSANASTSTDNFVIPWGIGVDSQGNFYIGGAANSGSGSGTNVSDFFIAKYNANCERQWIRKFGSNLKDGFTDPSEPFGFNLVVDATGNSYLMGVTYGIVADQYAVRGADIAIISYDPSGVQRWARQFGGGSKDTPGKLVLSGGTLYAFGSSNGPLAGPHTPPDGGEPLANGFVLGLSTSDGRTTLSKQFAEDLFSPFVYGAVTPDGSILYRGNDLKKLNSNGDVLWSRPMISLLGTENRTFEVDVAASADELYLLATTLPITTPNAVAARPLLRKFNADATSAVSTFIEPATSRDTRGQWVRLDPDQTVTYQTSDYVSYQNPSAPGINSVKTFIRQTSSLHQGWQLELNYSGLGFATGPNPTNNTTSVYIAGGGGPTVCSPQGSCVAKIDVALQ